MSMSPLSTAFREDAAAALREWMEERGGDDSQPLFPSNRNRRLSRDAVARIVRKHVAAASRSCPSPRKRRTSTHCLRHAAAMTLLREEVPITIIALWLGHQSVESTMNYLHADPRIKEKAMERTRPVDVPPGRHQPEEQIIAFLESLCQCRKAGRRSERNQQVANNTRHSWKLGMPWNAHPTP